MTTNNNLSIEQMREIVDGAPDKTADTYVADIDTYFSAEFGSYFDHTEFDWLDSDYKSYAEIRANYETVFWLKDLRTAIAKHDFKAGDLVVSKDKNDQALYEIKRIHYNKIDGWNYLYLKNTMYKNSGERGDYVDKYEHASEAEIKAGHRLEAERHG